MTRAPGTGKQRHHERDYSTGHEGRPTGRPRAGFATSTSPPPAPRLSLQMRDPGQGEWRTVAGSAANLSGVC
jgi:hypothetical protein